MSFWNDERDAELRRLWDGDEGSLSFSDIAARLDCSRNAAIGRAHRLGLKRASYAPKPPRPQRPRTNGGPPRIVEKKKRGSSNFSPLTSFPTARAKTKPSKETLRMVVDPGQALAESILVELWSVKDSRCRFPYGEPSDVDSFRFCGAPKANDSPYCWAHHCLGHTNPSSERPDTTYRLRKSGGNGLALSGRSAAEEAEAA